MNRNAKRIPSALEDIPEEYAAPCKEPGTLIELDYNTYESITYDSRIRVLCKRALVYLPLGYSDEKKYNIYYMMHGGTCNETTIMGTPRKEKAFKNQIDHAVMSGKIQPLIIVIPTYNNLSSSDSYDFELALKLTNNYHNELVNDLIPAVESQFRTFAEKTTRDGLKASRDHRAFGGFSMGSVTTWRTFQYCLDYFRYFCPSSGNLTDDGTFMAEIVQRSGYAPDDFFILSATGTNDFNYHAFSSQIRAMKKEKSIFHFADNEAEGNLFSRVVKGGTHGETYQNIYAYNNLMWLWKEN